MMKQKKYTLIFILFAVFSVNNESFSQTIFDWLNSSYTQGYIVKINGDTVPGLLKDMSDAASCSYIKLKDSKTNKKIKYYPSQIKYYKRGTKEFYQVNRYRLGGYFPSFMQADIKGLLTLYTYSYTTHGYTGGMYSMSYSYNTSMQYIQKPNNVAIPIVRLDFKNKVSDYLSDYPDLSLKIKNKTYRYTDIKLIVNEYNSWYSKNYTKKDKPEKDKLPGVISSKNNIKKDTLINDGDFAVDQVVEDVDLSDIKTEKPKSSKRQLSIQIPANINISIITIPDVVNEVIYDEHGGPNYDIGWGVCYRFNQRNAILTNFHFWNTMLNVNYIAKSLDDSGNEINYEIRENGQFSYSGINLYMLNYANNFYAGYGLNMSFKSTYKCDYSIYMENTEDKIYQESKVPESPLVTENKMDLALSLAFGYQISTARKVTIIPNIGIDVSVLPLVETGLYSVDNNGNKTKYNISLMQVKFGLIFEIKKTKK